MPAQAFAVFRGQGAGDLTELLPGCLRLTGLGGDAMLAMPMIASPGQECAKIKELRASEKDMPVWGDLRKRAAMWELTTAMSLLYAGADILIMYNPEAVAALKQAITRLMDKKD